MTKFEDMVLPANLEGDSAENIFFSHASKMLFDALDKRIRNLSPSVKREFKKLYIAYKLDTNFVDIVFQEKRLRVSINMKFSDIVDKYGICRDITWCRSLEQW